MVRRMIVAGMVTMMIAVSAGPAVAAPPRILPVNVDCPSGSQTIGFIDNNGSIVGFDESGQVAQVRRINGEFSMQVRVEDVLVFNGTESFTLHKGNGKALEGQLESCTFQATFFEGSAEVTEEFAAQFEADFGSDVLFSYIGQDVDFHAQVAGTASLRFPRR